MGFLSQTFITQGFESSVKKNCPEAGVRRALVRVARAPVKVYTAIVIVLVPVGSVRLSVLQTLAGDLTALGFSAEVAVGNPIPVPLAAYDPGRRQFLSTAVLEAALGERRRTGAGRAGRTAKAVRILGVIDRDLYVPRLNYVFGTAGGSGAVISLTRLRQSFYGRTEDEDLFRKRVLTEAVHELGHTFGLVHCPNACCVMYFSNSLGDTDRKGPGFCSACKARLSAAPKL
jgi:archaemetzincin